MKRATKNKFLSYRELRTLKIHILIVWLLVCLSFFSVSLNAQPTKEKLYQGVILDEYVVKDVAGGFDVMGFIQKVKKDTTFYKAFKTLRLMNFTMYSDIEIENKKKELKASYHSLSKQVRTSNCRKTFFESERVSGDFFTSRRAYRYYTAKLFAHLFFTNGEVCGENNIVGGKVYGGNTKYEEQLRMLIFNPGQRISGIPGIGKNVAIFDEPVSNQYMFKLTRALYNEEECYIFKAIPKAAFKNDVVINELKTWFRLSDFAIVARDYSLSFKTLFYDFDVIMHVKLKMVKKQLVPYEVSYNGNWHVFSKPREIATFTAIFTDFE